MLISVVDVITAVAKVNKAGITDKAGIMSELDATGKWLGSQLMPMVRVERYRGQAMGRYPEARACALSLVIRTSRLA